MSVAAMSAIVNRRKRDWHTMVDRDPYGDYPDGGFLSGEMKMQKRMRRPRRYGRGNRRNRRRRVIRRRVPRSVQPYQVVRSLKSVVAFSLNPAAGTIYVETLQLNNAYDPTGTLGAGQPLGFDQYAALYNRYSVVAWSAKFEVCSTDNSNPIVVGFTPQVSSTGLSAYEHYKEAPGTVSTIITPDIDKTTFFARGGVKKYFVPPSGRMLSDDRLTPFCSAGPTSVLYGHVFAQAMDNTADPAIIRCVCTLWQKVVFFNPLIPSRS